MGRTKKNSLVSGETTSKGCSTKGQDFSLFNCVSSFRAKKAREKQKKKQTSAPDGGNAKFELLRAEKLAYVLVIYQKSSLITY